MAVVQVLLLVVAVLGVLVRPARLPNWSVPLASAVVLVAIGGSGVGETAQILRQLIAPLAFLLLAVPLAMMLDRLGFFSSLAALVDKGPTAQRSMWILAAAVTTFLNLDASVVLLTPLYIRIARRHHLDARTVAFQPVLLACLASSALPVSNLTNLIAAQQRDIGVVDFAVHLGPASLAAVVVGWLAYRRMHHDPVATDDSDDRVDQRALRLGAPVVAFVVVGFTLGGAFGIPAWTVALIADAVLLAMTRGAKAGDLPLGAAALASGLAIVAAAAGPHLGLDRFLNTPSWGGQLQAAALGVAGANTINNLPALLVSLPALRPHSSYIWPLLFGVNFGPIFVLHGSLAGLLWRNTASRLDVHVTGWEYTKIGLRVGFPALTVALGIVVVTNQLLQ